MDRGFSSRRGMQRSGESSRFTHLLQSKVRFSAGPLAAAGSWRFIAKYRLDFSGAGDSSVLTIVVVLHKHSTFPRTAGQRDSGRKNKNNPLM